MQGPPLLTAQQLAQRREQLAQTTDGAITAAGAQRYVRYYLLQLSVLNAQYVRLPYPYHQTNAAYFELLAQLQLGELPLEELHY